MTDIQTALIIGGTFLIAGSVKGIIGLGLPTVSLGILAAAFDLKTAMALLIIPSLVTNIWQAAVGGNGAKVLRRIWPFLCLATATIWIGAKALTSVDASYLSILLGVLLLLYSTANLIGFQWTISPQQEKWVGPLIGTTNGLLTGMTGSFVVPGVMYLQAIGLTRDMLVQAMGMLFSLSTIGLAFALQKNSLLSAHLAIASAYSVFPAIIGMVVGQRVRRNLSEKKFRKTFFIAIFILGAFIIGKSIALLA